MLKDLIFEADPDADPNQPLAVLLLMVWANAKNDGVSIWDSTALRFCVLNAVPRFYGRVFRSVTESLNTERDNQDRIMLQGH